MIEKTVVINNQAGIHCRPASAILSAISKFPGCRFNVSVPGRDTTELNSILNLIALGLQQGDTVRLCVSADDPDEELKAADEISGLFAKEFDFPPRV